MKLTVKQLCKIAKLVNCISGVFTRTDYENRSTPYYFLNNCIIKQLLHYHV